MLGALAGVTTGILFVVGHDAAHGSLVPGRRCNRFIAMAAFFPSLHPVCTWEIGHNKLHHGWTNLKGKDEVYAPLSAEEYMAMPPARQLLHRIYRSAGGFGLYYMIDIWWRCQILRKPLSYHECPNRLLWIDFGALGVSLLGAVTVSIWAGSTLEGAVTNLVLCMLLPFVVWNYVMTFVTLQQHTHPRVRWFDCREEWSYFAAQVEGTVHVLMPRTFDWLFARIFQHSAHHIDKTIPLYRLVEAQRRAEQSYPECVVTKFTLSAFLRLLRECQIYDYRSQRWESFKAVSAGVK